VRIRKFKDEDARKVFYLIRKALCEVNGKDYPPETIAGMVRHVRPSNLISMSRKRKIYVVADGARILATGALADNWILSFYVNPNYHGREVGTYLINYLEKLANKDGHDCVYVPSSFTAIGFCEKRGFKSSRDQSKASKDWVILSKTI
jgi:GNAT superfamily N-acetyltransferase